MTIPHGILLSLVPAGYFIGSVPFGYLVGLARGIDVRKAGSGNIGATNVGRLLGKKFFVVVFLLDLLKGLVPMLAARALIRPVSQVDYLLWLSVGLATILGHMFSLFLRFKGGKGVATSCGVVLGVFPYLTLPVLVAAAVWAVALKTTRIMSIASIAGTLTMPLAYVAIGSARGWDVFGRQWPLLAFALLIASLIIFKHRSNLARLRAGTELRLARKPHRNGDGEDHDNGDGNGQPHGEPGVPGKPGLPGEGDPAPPDERRLTL